MKLSAAAAGLFIGTAVCWVKTLKDKDSKRTVELNPELSSLLKNYSVGYTEELVSLSKELDEFSLNEAMELMSESTNIRGNDMALLFAENKIVRNKSYKELIDYGFGYGLTWFLRALPFSTKGLGSPFDRHIYAAMLYGKEDFPPDEWHDQLELDWDTHYQAIFKADNPVLLAAMFSDPGVIFQEGKSSQKWRRPTETTFLFIKKHLHRLITYYDSARILKALINEEDFASHFLSDSSIMEIQTIIKTSLWDYKTLHITGHRQKLRILLDTPILRRVLGYDELEFALEHGYHKSSAEQMSLNIFSRDYDWALEVLYRRGLLGTTIEMEFISRAIKKGSYKIFGWIYDRLYELPALKEDLEALIESFAHQCPQNSACKHWPKLRYEILKVHKSAFANYVPSQEVVNRVVPGAEALKFLDTFDPKLYPEQDFLYEGGDLDWNLRAYQANPTWDIDDYETLGAMDRNHSGLVGHALGQRVNQKMDRAFSLQLIQHNAKVDKNYLPSEREVKHAFSKDDIRVVEWLYEQVERSEQHREEYLKYLQLSTQWAKSPELAKRLKDDKDIEPSEIDMIHFATVGNLEACEWVWTFLKDKQLELAKLNPILISKKEVIQWWRENIDEYYMPNVSEAIVECAKRHDIDSARWIAEQWDLNILSVYLDRINDYTHSSEATRIDFFELIYIYQENVSSGSIRDLEVKIRSRPNLKRIMAEHVRAGHHIPLDVWEFILHLSELYGGVNLRALKEMVARGDDEIIELLRIRGHLKGHEDIVRGDVDGITGNLADMTI